MSKEERHNGRILLEREYGAVIGESRREFRRIALSDFSSDFDYINHYVTAEYGMEICLSKNDYDRLISYLGYTGPGYRRGHDERMIEYYKELEIKINNERHLRESTPALQKAYDKYRVMLDMVKNGQEIEN